jgi:hypothetical protein
VLNSRASTNWRKLISKSQSLPTYLIMRKVRDFRATTARLGLHNHVAGNDSSSPNQRPTCRPPQYPPTRPSFRHHRRSIDSSLSFLVFPKLACRSCLAEMFKLARSRPVASALRTAAVRRDNAHRTRSLLMQQQQSTASQSSRLQQKRFLSIHEYLSANLLKTVRLHQIDVHRY